MNMRMTIVIKKEKGGRRRKRYNRMARKKDRDILIKLSKRFASDFKTKPGSSGDIALPY